MQKPKEKPRILQKLIGPLINRRQNDDFLNFLDKVEDLFAKLLALAMLGVVLFAITDLGIVLVEEVISPPVGRFPTDTLLKVVGLFLNILIALEIIQNITSYLSSHVIQIEIVIITSLIAVSRKIIILDFDKISYLELFALAATIFALSICYWLVRRTNAKYPPH